MLTKTDIKLMHLNGYEHWRILREALDKGMEWPDAVERIRTTLYQSDEEKQEMLDAFDCNNNPDR